MVEMRFRTACRVITYLLGLLKKGRKDAKTSKVVARTKSGKKELHRSKTLPIIRAPKGCFTQEEAQPAQATLEVPKPLSRKQSVPILNILKRSKTTPDGPKDALSHQYYRSKSCERRRSMGFVDKYSPPLSK
ncbi:uncharacterized protein LOC132743083, partial [Ruditapes philippinarum]|uniref:uncharacterized protein LOC132743083 n=1 Tax=Ruditapes philippinarum TaxID=129788 RepID=UPI00295BE68D